MEILPACAVDVTERSLLAVELIHAFGHAYPGWTVNESTQELANESGLPQSVVARMDGRAIGCASLLSDDEVSDCDELTPWLGNLWVEPAQRGRGVGRELVSSIVNAARASGAASLHLVTDSAADWYRTMGWHDLGPRLVHGRPMTLLVLDLR